MTNAVEAPQAEDGNAPGEGFVRPTLWGLIRAHKRAAAGGFAIILALLSIVLVSDLAPGGSRIADSTSCSVWSSATQHQRDMYAARYVKEHGPLPSGATDSGTIEGVIDSGCTMAYGFDEADTVTVLQAVRHQY